jgi:uncharacterized protein YecT (DUF1311 family)
MSVKVIVVFALMSLANAAAQAEEQFDYGGVKIDIAVSPAYTSCFEAAAGNDPNMAVCITAETTLWDQRLNAAYAKLRARLSKSDFAVLQAFQRLWVGDRDVACRDDGQNGTAGRVASDSCVLRITAVRAAELEMRTTGSN